MNSQNVNQQSRIIELAIFKTKEGVAHNDALNALLALNSILNNFEGFIDRQLSKNEEGVWFDIVNWESMDLAKKASEEIMKHEKALDVFAIMNQESLQFHHLTPLNYFKN
jgi:hypothetical protein